VIDGSRFFGINSVNTGIPKDRADENLVKARLLLPRAFVVKSSCMDGAHIIRSHFHTQSLISSRRSYTNRIVAHHGQVDPLCSAQMAEAEDKIWGMLIEYRAQVQEIPGSKWKDVYQSYLASKLDEQLSKVESLLRQLPMRMPGNLHSY